MNWFEKQYNRIIEVISEKPEILTENFETLILRGGAEVIVDKFEKGHTAYINGIDGKMELKDDLWDLENGTQFRTSGHKIVEIIKPKKEFNFETIEFESEEEKSFISECIREVMEAGETDNNEQAYAICKVKYEKKTETMESPEMENKLENAEEPVNPEMDKYAELEAKLSALEMKLTELESKITPQEDMSKYTALETFNSFKNEVDDRIKNINGSAPLKKIDFEEAELSDYERFMNKSLKK